MRVVLERESRETVVEAQRDQWQRPTEVLGALALRDGATVVDLGSGAGYFALKLSPAVGAQAECWPRCDERFIDRREDDDVWWLLVARKPARRVRSAIAPRRAFVRFGRRLGLGEFGL